MSIIKVCFFSCPSNVFLGELFHPDAYNLEYIPWKLHVVSKTSAGESNCDLWYNFHHLVPRHETEA